MTGAKPKTHRNREIALAVENGALYSDLARIHKVTPSRIEQICRAQGVKSKLRFTPEETAKVRAHMQSDGRPYALVLEGRSASGIYNHCLVLDLHTPWVDQDKWDAKQDQVIIDGYYPLGSRVVAKQLKRTRNEVIGRANRLKKLGKLTPPKEVY